jgi:hypothetical protein
LSLNPLKLAGQCGKLKCCLNFELDTYLDALKSFPKQDLVLKTEKGDAVFVKMDIFKKHLWYTYKEERFKWFRLTLEQVQEIIDLNKNNEKSMSLEEYESDVEIPVKVDFEDAAGQDSLTRFDVPKTSKRRRNNRNKRRKKPVAVAANQTKAPVKRQQPKRKPKQNTQGKPANSNQQNSNPNKKTNSKRNNSNTKRNASNNKNKPPKA